MFMPTMPYAPPWGLRLVRRVRRMNRTELSAAAGLPVELIADYERERQPLPSETLLNVIATLRLTEGEREMLRRSIPHFDPREWWSNPDEVPPPYEAMIDEVNALVTARLRQYGIWRTLKGASPEEVRADMNREGVKLMELGHHLMLVMEMILQAKLRKIARTPSPRHREEAAEIWARLKPEGIAGFRVLVVHSGEAWHWSCCELLGLESCERATKDPELAMELAELTVECARVIQGEPAWRRRLRGFALACLGNAQLARGDRACAEETLTRARRLWDAGQARGTDILDGTPLRTLEASLHR